MHGHLNVKKNPRLCATSSVSKTDRAISLPSPTSTPGTNRSIVLMITRDGTAATESYIVQDSLHSPYTPSPFEP